MPSRLNHQRYKAPFSALLESLAHSRHCFIVSLNIKALHVLMDTSSQRVGS